VLCTFIAACFNLLKTIFFLQQFYSDAPHLLEITSFCIKQISILLQQIQAEGSKAESALSALIRNQQSIDSCTSQISLLSGFSSNFIELLRGIIKKCNTAFTMKRATDELIRLKSIQDLLTMLVTLIRVPVATSSKENSPSSSSELAVSTGVSSIKLEAAQVRKTNIYVILFLLNQIFFKSACILFWLLKRTKTWSHGQLNLLLLFKKWLKKLSWTWKEAVAFTRLTLARLRLVL